MSWNIDKFYESKKIFNYLVSIVIPVYNVETYLEKCLQSVLQQSYTNIEIILVNDGSTDNSGIICDEYASKDSRVKVIHQKNIGSTGARKTGIKFATGKFVSWMDADDWVEKSFISDFVELQQKTNADLVAMALYHDIGQSSTININNISNGVYSLEEIISELLYSGEFYTYGITPHLVTKFFRRKIIEESIKNVDERIIAGDDAAATYGAILKCGIITVNNKANYHYIQRSNSITKTKFSNEEIRINMLVDYLKKIFIKHNKSILLPQVDIYRNYLFILRNIEYFDIGYNNVKLVPYGGIPYGSKVIIYGAGVTGKMIYNYLKKDNVIEVMKWIDKNCDYYKSQGFDVDLPDSLSDYKESYDYIIIANISYSIANEIKNFLLNFNIESDKILWLSDEFCSIENRNI